MRPNTNERLAGIERTLALIADDPGLSAQSADLLADARRQLTRMTRTTDEQRRRFLQWDNDAMIELWMKAGEFDIINVDQSHDLLERADIDNRTLASENEGWRRLFEMMLDELPDTDDGRQVEALIVAHLKARADANPDLNKNPTTPWEHE